MRAPTSIRTTLCSAALFGVALAMASPAGAVDPTTTSTSVAPTTSTPMTTTTLPVTTTTALATTTTTKVTTTTAHVTTTTAAAKAKSNAAVWAWILGGVALVALIIAGVAAIMGSKKRREAGDAWVPQARAGLENASLARTMLMAQPTGGDAQVTQVRAQGEDAARALDRVATVAPDEARRQAASSVAEGLRGVIFCLEAEHLLRSGTAAPTAAQLAEADVARRRRAAELDASLAQLDSITRPPTR